MRPSSEAVMAQYLFKNFLADPQQYQAARAYWESTVAQLAAELNQRDEWLPRMATAFGNGSPLPRDGNPIFEARSTRLRRALRVVQEAAETNGPEIIAYLDRIGGASDEDYMDELVFRLALSDETARIAQRLIRMWLDERTTRAAAEAAIAEAKA